MLKPCIKCAKDFDVKPSTLARGKGKYCSRLCSDGGKKVKRNCTICMTEFETHFSKSREDRGKFCSMPCYRKSRKGGTAWNKGKPAPWSVGNKHRLGVPNMYWRTVKKVGKENPHWKGGVTVGIENRKEYFSFKNLQKFNNKRNAEGSHTLQEWHELKKRYGNKCLCCGISESEVTISIDHVMPIVLGGSDYISNIQPLCTRCNSKKHTKSTDYRLRVE